jgi:hypothetical protein
MLPVYRFDDGRAILGILLPAQYLPHCFLSRAAPTCLHAVCTLYSPGIGAHICRPRKEPRNAQPSHHV